MAEGIKSVNCVEYHVPVDDTYMNVARFGTGSKKLLIIAGISLCGLEGQGEGVAAAYARFAEDYTVYVFERRKLLPPGFRVEDMAEDIYRVCQTENITKADILGASQGGMIAQCLAVFHPDFANRLVVCSSQCRTTDKMKRFCEDSIELIRKYDVVGINRYFFRKVYSPAFLEKNREYLPVLEKQGSAEDCDRFKVLVDACAVFDIKDKMNAIRCPALVIGDKNDETIGVEGSYEIISALNCQSIIYDAYSHAVYDEAEDVRDRIYAFLRK